MHKPMIKVAYTPYKEESLNILGVDVGGTNTKLGIVNSEGIILSNRVMPTLAHETIDHFLDRLFHEASLFEESYDAVGLGMPNLNPKTGSLQGQVNLSWGDQELMPALKAHFSDKEVRIDNDANIAAIGEKVFGLGRDSSDFVVITLGTGLGTGIFVNNHIVHGSNGLGAEGGHITLIPGGRQCPCSGQGHIEAYVSVKGIEQTCLELTQKSFDFRTIQAHFMEGNHDIDIVIDQTAQYLALALSSMQALLAPDKFIITGGISSLGDRFAKMVTDYLNEYGFKPLRGSAKVEISLIPPEVGAILGAAGLFYI